MASYKVEQFRDSVMNLYGKNLFYCKEFNYLYWTDVTVGSVFRMDFNNHNSISMFKILGENTISFCVPIYGKKDQYIVGAGRRLLHVTWDGHTTMGQITKVLTEVPINGVRINQFNVDKQGRLYFGTMLSEEHGNFYDFTKRVGGLYRFTMTEGLVQLKDNVGMGNGITFNNTFTKMYFVDSFDLNIFEYDFDFKTGSICKIKKKIDFVLSWLTLSSFNSQPEELLRPDQLRPVQENIPNWTHYRFWRQHLCHHVRKWKDPQDQQQVSAFCHGIWIRFDVFSSSRTHKFDFEYKTNVNQVTGLVFGEKNLDTMYVSTAGMGFNGYQPTYPSGYLMRVHNTGVHGMDMYRFVL